MNESLKYIHTPIEHKHQIDTLYYDASCPLCSREINHLKKLQKGGLHCADIYTELPSALNSQTSDMLRVLHLYQKDGGCLVGLDATVGAWKHTSLSWIFSWLRWPVIKPLADKVYFLWANKRYQKKYACGTCQD
ncbi:MAG: putative DCC family thiol-disulfide oxidoreductase YuxK [Candidatus Endobugula sp.]|jgi:predicted DCC family thiol-disulfide oxidoreductase YuxK